MNPNLLEASSFIRDVTITMRQCLIIPLSLLLTFILIFSLVATKEITVTSQGEIAPYKCHCIYSVNK